MSDVIQQSKLPRGHLPLHRQRYLAQLDELQLVRLQAGNAGWGRTPLNTMPDWKSLELGSDGRRRLDTCSACTAEVRYERALWLAAEPQRERERERERIRVRDERRAAKKADRDSKRAVKIAAKRAERERIATAKLLAKATAAGTTVAKFEVRRAVRLDRKIARAAQGTATTRAPGTPSPTELAAPS